MLPREVIFPGTVVFPSKVSFPSPSGYWSAENGVPDDWAANDCAALGCANIGCANVGSANEGCAGIDCADVGWAAVNWAAPGSVTLDCAAPDCAACLACIRSKGGIGSADMSCISAKRVIVDIVKIADRFISIDVFVGLNVKKKEEWQNEFDRYESMAMMRFACIERILNFICLERCFSYGEQEII
jgi:hypothetical protein